MRISLEPNLLLADFKSIALTFLPNLQTRGDFPANLKPMLELTCKQLACGHKFING